MQIHLSSVLNSCQFLVNSCQFLEFRKTSADPIRRSATAMQIMRNGIDGTLTLKNNFQMEIYLSQPAEFLSISCKFLSIWLHKDARELSPATSEKPPVRYKIKIKHSRTLPWFWKLMIIRLNQLS